MPIGPSGETTATPKPAPRIQPGRVVLRRAAVDVAGVEEDAHVEDWLTRAPELDTLKAAYDLPKAFGLAPVGRRQRVEAVRGDRELVVAPQRDAELHAAHRVQLGEERPGIAENEAGLAR